jgi:TolB protein
MAYAASDDHIYLAEADGSNRRPVTAQVSGLSTDKGWSFRWPTYSPDAKQLAFAGYRTVRSGLGSAAVLVSDVEHLQPKVLLESADLAPIYLYWSPDSRYLTALLQRGSDLALYLFDTSGTDQPRQLLVGQPLYWSWAPDGKSVAVHVGADAGSDPSAWVGVLHLGTNDAQTERFGEAPGLFRAPAWSPSGAQLAFASLGGGTSLLAVRDAGGRVTNLASGAGNLAFNWSPSGEWLAFAYGDVSLAGFYRSVEVVHPDGSDRRTLSQDPVVAFYWSPDATQVAVVGFDSGARALTWTVVTVDGKTKRPLGSFAPSTDFGFALPFFDQYAQSTSVWSSDSKKIVYGVQRPDQSEQIMVVGADGATPVTQLAYGGAAVWSPPVVTDSK